MVKKEQLLSSSDGHMEMLLKNANSLVKQVTWESKFFHHKNLFSLMNGHRMVNSTPGGSCTSQHLTNLMADMELEMS
jgi:hypothetical protein